MKSNIRKSATIAIASFGTLIVSGAQGSEKVAATPLKITANAAKIASTTKLHVGGTAKPLTARPHRDSTGGHGDIGHADTTIRHYDFTSTAHGDESAVFGLLHADATGSPHADATAGFPPFTLHADATGTHSDTPSSHTDVPHSDTTGGHGDVGVKGEANHGDAI